MIQVVTRALEILEFVALSDKEPVRLINIAHHLQLSQSTTANIVKALVYKNYLEQVNRKAGYRLGIAAYSLTSNSMYTRYDEE